MVANTKLPSVYGVVATVAARFNARVKDASQSHKLFSSRRFDEYSTKEFSFYEITKEEYDGVVSLFKDDRPDKGYVYGGWYKKSANEGEVVVVGKDRDSAFKKAMNNNPNFIVGLLKSINGELVS